MEVVRKGLCSAADWELLLLMMWKALRCLMLKREGGENDRHRMIKSGGSVEELKALDEGEKWNVEEM